MRETTRSAELAMVANVSLGVMLGSRDDLVLCLKNSSRATLQRCRGIYLKEEMSRGRAMAGHRCIKHQNLEKGVIEYLAMLNKHFHDL